MATVHGMRRVSKSVARCCVSEIQSIRSFAWGAGSAGLGKADIISKFERKQAEDLKRERAAAYLDSRDKPKETVGGAGYVPPLARGDVSDAAGRASVHGGSEAERSIRAWLESGGDQGLKGSGERLPDKDEHHQMFTSDAGTRALNRALKEAGIKPPSIEAAEELRKAEDRVISGLKYALRKNRDASTMELEDAVRMARQHCEQLIKQYNSALLADKETFGSNWPLHQRKQRTIDEEIALARG
eukprot:TRINITY_DN47247_c0_g1_i1.p1 TRINITY_DN47247_c0_g1~~TRINITY_DN47247_c0_g1_i1.p1  ORF type:complete len:243 (+),score=51.24 TRINITY_DN47247_c0_g1_i1:84-812(+)